MPPFVLRGKELALPKVNGKRVMEREMEERDMHIMDDTPDNTYGSNQFYRSTGGNSDSESPENHSALQL